MVNDQDYHRAGVPTSLLGCSYNNWRKVEILAILDHYGRNSRRLSASKLELMRLLDQLVQDRPLTREDKWRILRAYWRRPDSQLQALVASNVMMNGQRPSENAPRDGEHEEEESILEPDDSIKPACIICFDNLDHSNMPSRNITTSC